MKIKVSAAMARQPFHGCTPDYIANTCHARCCRSATAPTGTVITIHPSEAAQIIARGGVIIDGLLQPKPGCKKCPFQNDQTHLCDIHFTPDKPFGCIASPFTLNKNRTLIVRNRYRSLKCYNAGPKLPAYVAFRASLDLIFGPEEAARICQHLEAGGDDIEAEISDKNLSMLLDNDSIKSAALHPVENSPKAATMTEPTAPTTAPKEPKLPVVRCAFTRMVPIDDLLRRKHPQNPNTHPEKQIRLLAKIFEATGIRAPFVVSNLSGLMTRGHGRLEAALLAGYTELPCDFQDYDSAAQELEDLIADNAVAELSAMDKNRLDSLLTQLATDNRDPELAGIIAQVRDIETARKSAAGALKAKFIVSPFTILNTTGKDWQDRRALWLALGIASEVGRNDDLVYGSSSQPPHFYTAKEKFDATQGRKTTWDEFFRFNPHLPRQCNTSIFNPVVCEVFYNWFLPSKGHGAILDPFAGGSVRGIVAAFLGHSYTGIELRPEQIAANEANAKEIFEALNMTPNHWPKWIQGDSTKLRDLIEPTARFDMIFTCPPYGDLEKYSDDPADLSAQPAETFAANYTAIIRAALDYLLPNRFSIWIIGDYRDKATGFQRAFPSLTIEAHKPKAGLYNHAVLLTPANSLAIRVSSFFPKSRKLGRTHQDATIFFRGDPIAIDAAAQAATTDVTVFFNGKNDADIKEQLGPLSAREIVPLGDILKALTAKTTAQ